MNYYLRTTSIVLTLERAVNEGQAVGVGQRVRWREQLTKDRLWTSDSASVGVDSTMVNCIWVRWKF
jgi:hypothetical protein